jgi:putative DNA modification/repair radical SAM protein
MDRVYKLTILADAAKYDSSCASSGSIRKATPGGIGHANGTGICHSYTPDGRCVSLLKILLTNFCIYDCRYCVNRISSDVPRARFNVAEVVELTLDFYRRNYIGGLFLSSGIIQSPDYTMEQLVVVARTLRETHRFGGYIHLKIIPGASETLIAEAGRWADRLSANVELAVEAQLIKLAPEKRHAVIETSMQQIRDGVRNVADNGPSRAPAPRFAPAGQSTQMIVGAGGESDRDILAKASHLYTGYGLRRVYYSAFSPFQGADDDLPPAAPPVLREHRLYQADWLFRFYGFTVDELTTPAAPDLDLRADPKLAWALRHPESFPLDINRAPYELLLRVPGFGRRTVSRLIKIRRHHRVNEADLRRLGVRLQKARSFIVTADGAPVPLPVVEPKQTQLALFDRTDGL